MKHAITYAPCILVLGLVACGPDDLVEAGEPARADDAPDEFIGDEYGEPDPEPGCGNDCGDLPENPVIDDTPDPEDGPDVDAPNDDDEVISSVAPGPSAGSTMVTKGYAGFHKTSSPTSALKSIPPHGGVADNALHPSRNPAGTIPPGHRVSVVSATPQHGLMKVKYKGKVGWVKTSKLVWRDPSLSRRAFALQPSVRNAFFKHQIRRNKWNKDGPLHSGNCAPTSLAMAANILGKETSGLSVEQSIHRVRAKYDGGLHESQGTTRTEIKEAAQELGLHVHTMASSLGPTAALNRLKNQLAAGRVVILAGQPGKPGSGPTLYEKAFNRAYKKAIDNGANLYHSTYNFNGHHAILVLGRDGGDYVVGDPISEVGFVTLSPAEMKDFMKRFTGNKGTGNAVWR